jgi:hypothetical protein
MWTRRAAGDQDGDDEERRIVACPPVCPAVASSDVLLSQPAASDVEAKMRSA